MSKKKILIVDDELDMRIFLSTVLETSGYQPVTTRNGLDGVSKARTGNPDLILLDVMMPGEGGVQMYRKLKMDPELAPIPVVMLSAVGKKSFYHYLRMLNFSLPFPIPQPAGYLEKPVDPDQLLTLIKSILPHV
jgi:two-component system, OmpR family, phosphate regulon response regulator PhoB